MIFIANVLNNAHPPCDPSVRTPCSFKIFHFTTVDVGILVDPSSSTVGHSNIGKTEEFKSVVFWGTISTTKSMEGCEWGA